VPVVKRNDAGSWPLAFRLNGKKVRARVDPRQTLLDFLRLEAGLTGTKGACLEGECGSCYVLVDGRPCNSCLVLAPQVQGRDVVTVEGLASDGRLDVVQRKFVEHGAVQCGYCTPGLIIAARALLDRAPQLTREELLVGLEGNICRCTGYNTIVRAVEESARELGLSHTSRTSAASPEARDARARLQPRRRQTAVRVPQDARR
jgi:carbon-monoxide dehydrogenase small subunit